ncbi:MAG: lipocalin family protein [Bacteroidota bacterium]
MKTIFLFLTFSFLFVFSSAQTNSDTLTNEKVILLLKAGLQPSLIITKIKTSTNRFEVTTEDLIKLNNSGVPSEVINAMINPNPTEDNIILANDSVSIYKKWKVISQITDGKVMDMHAEITTQYNKDGTYFSTVLYFKTNKKSENSGEFKFSTDKKSITYFHEKGSPYTAEIIKLTDKQLEIKGYLQGSEYRTIHTVVEK